MTQNMTVLVRVPSSLWARTLAVSSLLLLAVQGNALAQE